MELKNKKGRVLKELSLIAMRKKLAEAKASGKSGVYWEKRIVKRMQDLKREFGPTRPKRR